MAQAEMRRLRYNVASSLDGFIAGPAGEYDWIIQDPTINFEALFAEFDTALMGRRTFETMVAQGSGGMLPGLRTVVCSRSLDPGDWPDITVLSNDFAAEVTRLKSQAGKDIWLFGGGVLFRSLIDAGLVDTVELALIPVLLGDGIPLLAGGPRTEAMKLTQHEVLASGIIRVTYAC